MTRDGPRVVRLEGGYRTLVSALGVYLSVLIDLPTGATIVCTFGLVLVLMFLVYTLVPAWRGSREIRGAHSVTQEEA